MKKVVARRREGYAHELAVRTHTLLADEPPDAGGTDTGPTPTELLALSLASCTAITVEMYAGRKGWDLGEVEVEVSYELEAATPTGYEVVVNVPRPLDDDQRDRLHVIAGKCPVHRALTGDVTITDRVQAPPTGPAPS